MEQLFDDLEDFGSFDDAISGDVRDPYTELARLRHPTCVNPICSVPSRAGDLDHHRPWAASDPDTSAANLGPLCRTDHLLKTHAGYRVDRVGDTLYEITTPPGHRYRSVATSPRPGRWERGEVPERSDRPPPF